MDHIMMSYNWSDSSSLADKIYDRLCSAGYRVWFDKKNMKGDKFEAMASAVNQASVVLVFASPKYKLSPDCKREAQFAADQRKRIIPIHGKADFKAEGWLGIIEAGKIYYDFSQDFESTFENLLKDIGTSGKAEASEKQPVNSDVALSGPETCVSSPRDVAIEKVRKLQNENREDDLIFQGICFDKQKIPVVHPRLLEVSFYEGESVPKLEEYNPFNIMKDIAYGREIKFEKLLERRKEYRFTSLVGYPGVGKSTLSKRLAKSSNFVCFHMKFMNMNYPPDYKLTLRELLLDKPYPRLSKEECQAAFDWILENEDQCMFIFDGYDQAEWTLTPKPPKESFDAPQKVADLVANICNSHFLPKARLIFTSRPHSMISVPESLRPDVTYLLQDLSFQDMKKLFFAFTEDKAEDLWTKFLSSAPQLVSYCLNPLILQYFIRSVLNPGTNIGEICTMTRTFASVLSNLRRSDNVRHDDIDSLTDQLSRIAYKATVNSTVVITPKSLKEENLDVETVQDLIIAFQNYKGYASKVFTGDTRLYFSHQTLQEFFTALFIKYKMSVSDFKNFVKKNLYNGRWETVRRFLFGLLVDLESNQESILKKRKCLINNITKELKLSSKKIESGCRLIDHWADIRECNDEEVATMAASYFPVDADISYTPLKDRDAHSLSYVLRRVDKRVERLVLIYCNLYDRTFALICSAINEMPGSICRLVLMCSNMSSKSVPQVCGILHKIERKVDLRYSFVGRDNTEKRNANEGERKQLQAAINQLDNWDLRIAIDDQTYLKKESHKFQT